MYRYALLFIFVFSLFTPIENAFAEEAKPDATKVDTSKPDATKKDAATTEPKTDFQKIVPRDEAAESGYGKTSGVAGPVIMAPTITAIGFPSPFRFGFEAKGWNLVGLGFDYGFLPQLTFSDVKVKYNSWRITARVFPFKGAFFAGVAFGKQNLTGQKAQNVTYSGTTYSVNVTDDLNTTIISPHIGWRWIWQNGFMFGMEYGVQLASNATSTVSDDKSGTIPQLATQQQFIDLKNQVIEQSNKYGNKTLPHFALIQLGYFF